MKEKAEIHGNVDSTVRIYKKRYVERVKLGLNHTEVLNRDSQQRKHPVAKIRNGKRIYTLANGNNYSTLQVLFDNQLDQNRYVLCKR